jgi:hypothetical protein
MTSGTSSHNVIGELEADGGGANGVLVLAPHRKIIVSLWLTQQNLERVKVVSR